VRFFGFALDVQVDGIACPCSFQMLPGRDVAAAPNGECAGVTVFAIRQGIGVRTGSDAVWPITSFRQAPRDSTDPGVGTAEIVRVPASEVIHCDTDPVEAVPSTARGFKAGTRLVEAVACINTNDGRLDRKRWRPKCMPMLVTSPAPENPPGCRQRMTTRRGGFEISSGQVVRWIRARM